MTLGGRSYHANLRSTPARGTYPRFCSGNNSCCSDRRKCRSGFRDRLVDNSFPAGRGSQHTRGRPRLVHRIDRRGERVFPHQPRFYHRHRIDARHHLQRRAQQPFNYRAQPELVICPTLPAHRVHVHRKRHGAQHLTVQIAKITPHPRHIDRQPTHQHRRARRRHRHPRCGRHQRQQNSCVSISGQGSKLADVSMDCLVWFDPSSSPAWSSVELDTS